MGDLLPEEPCERNNVLVKEGRKEGRGGTYAHEAGETQATCGLALLLCPLLNVAPFSLGFVLSVLSRDVLVFVRFEDGPDVFRLVDRDGYSERVSLEQSVGNRGIDGTDIQGRES